MEKREIPIFNRFDTISIIMPYYAPTHQAFILLSSLCSSARNKLDEFYEEFISCMREYSKNVRIESNQSFSKKLVPNDLFEISIERINDKSINSFIKFVKRLSENKGWYFNKHYMHSRVNIFNSICVSHMR